MVLALSKLVIIRTQRLSLCDEVWAGPITRLPDLFAILPAPEEAQILCAEVRAGDVGISLCSLLLCPDCRDCRLPVTMLYDPQHQEKPEVTPDPHGGFDPQKGKMSGK